MSGNPALCTHSARPSVDRRPGIGEDAASFGRPRSGQVARAPGTVHSWSVTGDNRPPGRRQLSVLAAKPLQPLHIRNESHGALLLSAILGMTVASVP